jgi:ABC-type sugar transport system ATPase subunit
MTSALVDSEKTPPVSRFECRAIEKRYAGVRALAGVDLHLTEGEVHGLIGPNGAGKSTLVKILVGAEQPDHGEIYLAGQVVRLDSPLTAARHGLALMPQETTVVPNLSVMDNISLGNEAARYGLRSARQCRLNAERILEAIGLDIDPRSPVGSLSSAHQRLVMMGRALQRDATLLILDEPTAGLHPHEMELVRASIRRLSSRHRVTVLLVSHHLSEIAALCERVCCIGEGRVVANLEPGEVTAEALISIMHDAVADGAAVAKQAEEQDEFDVIVKHPVPAASSGATAVRAGVELRNVSGSRLTDVTLSARFGEVTGITGLLGSGLPEVIDMIIGAVKPRAGVLSVRGKDVKLRNPCHAAELGIGYTSGERSTVAFQGASIRKNVSISALRRWFGHIGFSRRGLERRRTDEALAPFAIRHNYDLPLSSLSGGNQQRVLLARLLAADSEILVLRDPTVGVDIVAREQIWALIRSLKQSHAVVVASSEANELEAVCDRVYCLKGGRISADLTGDRLTRREISSAVV